MVENEATFNKSKESTTVSKSIAAPDGDFGQIMDTSSFVKVVADLEVLEIKNFSFLFQILFLFAFF